MDRLPLTRVLITTRGRHLPRVSNSDSIPAKHHHSPVPPFVDKFSPPALARPRCCMKTGITSQFLRRAVFPCRRKIGREVLSAAYVHHGVGFSSPAIAFVGRDPQPATSPPVATMFNRAVKAAEANQPHKPLVATSTSAANPALKQQLFPSSSPSGTIPDMFKKPLIPAGSVGMTKASAAPDPLHNRSINITKPPTYAASGKAFASLYDRSDSFKESLAAVDLVSNSSHSLSGNSGSNTLMQSVYFADDDFSDDENLDLDFQAPCSVQLPRLPTPRANRQTIKENDPPPSQTSVLSWSQSSPSHHRCPEPRQELPTQRSAKRVSPDTIEPVRKKRQLPNSWAKPKLEEDDVEALYQDVTTPLPKAKAPLWNTTASAVKAQKKQLKKGSGSNKTDASTSDIRDAIKSNSKKDKAPIRLSLEQEHVKSLVVEKGQSVFFTGPAGTGKSVLMRSIIQALKKKHARDPAKVAVTASTGLAACNIGGMTLHSFSGIGLGKEDAQTLVKKVRRNPKAKERWVKTKILIIDEISMVDGELFDKLSQIGRLIRNNGRPWGGIQLVITGDFFQLPPVPDGSKQRDSQFAFEAATWNMSIDHTIGLTEVFRQRDAEFADMLNEMRLGRVSEQTVRNFQALSRPLQFDDGLEVTELFPTRNEVDRSNLQRLKALPGEPYRYDAIDTGADQIARERLLANMMAPPTIELKKNAQVMLIKNMDSDLVNGSLGTVMAFMSQAEFSLTEEDGGSNVETDSKRRVRAFANALSEGANKNDNAKYPLVKFHVQGSFRTILCCPEDWKVELPTGEIQASRKQLPLILAWALSIHKAQGQTLERVKVDLGKVFEKGQAYVALSRATTQEGLQVLRFQKEKVMAHPRVVGFYNKLYSAESALKKKAAGSITTYMSKTAVSAVASSSSKAVTKTQATTNRREVIDLDEEEALAQYA